MYMYMYMVFLIFPSTLAAQWQRFAQTRKTPGFGRNVSHHQILLERPIMSKYKTLFIVHYDSRSVIASV